MELTPTSETSGEKKKKRSEPRESIIKVADKAIEKQAERPSERPRSVYYGLEDNKEKPPVVPPPETLKLSKEDDDGDEAEEAESSAEIDAEDDRLAPEEESEVIEQIAESEAENLPEADSETEPEVAAELQAAEVFYENLKQKKNVDQAAAATYEAIGAEPEAEVSIEAPAEAETPEEVPAESVEGPQEFSEDEAEVNLRTPQAEESETAEPAEDEAEDEPTPAAANPSAGGGAGGSTGLPPQALAGHGPGPGGPVGPAGRSFNAAPTLVSSGNLNERQGPEYDQGNPAVTALVGGIIGYIIGKRRGRRLERKQWEGKYKKLEKNVTDLHWQVKTKEAEIRRVAARQAEVEGVEFMNRLDKAVEKSLAQAERAAPRRRRAPEARHLHGSGKHERIGHMLMAAEAAGSMRHRGPEAPQAYKEELRRIETARPVNDRRIETINRQELLLLSEKIVVDGTTLRQIYESKLIGERGLRRLVAEHLRGGDVKKVLRQEIIEREIDFERDPMLRDQPVYGASATGTGGPKANKTQLNELLAKAGASLPADKEEAAFYKARAAYEQAEREQQARSKQVMDAAFVAIILALLGVVVWLAISRG